MDKRISLVLFGIILLTVVVFALGYSMRSHEAAPGPARVQISFPANVFRLFGRVAKITSIDGKAVAKITLLENIDGQQDMENAAVADGVCTLQQVEKYECFSNPSYIRETGKTLDLKIDAQADIQMYARESRGGTLVNENGEIYFEQKSLEQFRELFAQADQYSYIKDISFYFGIKDDMIVRVQEKYQP